MALLMTKLQSSKIAPNSLIKLSFNYFAWERYNVFLEKSKTSSESNFKIFKAFSHFA